MGQMLVGLALIGLFLMNYWATRTRGPLFGKRALLITSLPAIALVAYSGFRFGYAIFNADEVNRRYQEGDLTYFMADMAFALAIVFGSVWGLTAFAGFCLGRSKRTE